VFRYTPGMLKDSSHNPPVRVMALMNQKGGVGKTTTTVNLAAAIANAGRSALVIDLDPQAHATLHLGHEPAQTEESGTVYDLLLDPEADPNRCVRAVADRLDIIVSETDLAAAEPELASAAHRHARLHRAMDRLTTNHEFILIDCPPSLGLLTTNALVAAQEVLIPMQAHFLALQGVGKLLETVQLIKGQLNEQLQVAGVVLCMHDAQATHTREVVADLEAFFDQHRETDKPWASARVYHPPIRRNIKLAECPSYGQTIFQYAPWAPGSMDYQKLAQTIIAEWDLALGSAQSNLSEAEIHVLRGNTELMPQTRQPDPAPTGEPTAPPTAPSTAAPTTAQPAERGEPAESVGEASPTGHANSARS
jgi:chromosome partitioning protein